MERKNKTTQHFAELVSMQKDIENELVVQAEFIKQVQSLMQNEHDHLSVIDRFPCPVAVFLRGGVIRKANHILIEKTDISIDEMPTGKISFLDRITNENFALKEDIYMKRILSLILASVLIFVLAGCGAKEPTTDKSNGEPKQTQTTDGPKSQMKPPLIPKRCRPAILKKLCHLQLMPRSSM